MYHPQAAYWINNRGQKCCDVLNRRWGRAWDKYLWAKANWYSSQQQKRIISSELNKDRLS